MKKLQLCESDLAGLRQNIAEVIYYDVLSRGYADFDTALNAAELITRIPLLRSLLVSNMADLPPERVGELIAQTTKISIKTTD